MNTAIRMVYPFLPVFGRGLGVDLWLISATLSLRSGIGILGPFLATIADAKGRKTGMLLGLGIYFCGTGCVVIWPAYPGFAAALILTLMGNLVFLPSMQAYLGDLVVYQKRGLVLGLVEFGWSLSFILGVPAMGFFLARYGWQAPFPILGALSLAAILITAWLVPSKSKTYQPSTSLLSNLRGILAFPPALIGLALGVCINWANEMVNLILGIWIEDSFQVKIAALGAASAVIGLSELGGESLVGTLTDRLGKPHSVAIGLILNCTSALLLFLLGQNLYGALAGLFLFYITFEFALVSSIPLMTEVSPTSRATMMALFASSHALGRALGDILSPHVYHGRWLPDGVQGILAISISVILLNGIGLVALTSLYRLLPAVRIKQVQIKPN